MILVTGANGMVGSYVQEIFQGEPLCLTDLEEMDITSPEAVDRMFEKIRPRFVLHLAAATDVDRCETEPDWACRINLDGTRNIAWASRQTGAVLVYVSTGGVFDGEEKTVYTEEDAPNPVNVYARTKLEGEKSVQRFVPNHFILRAGWMMGGGEKDKKFVSRMVQLCREKDEVFAVDDKFGTVTYAKDFLRTLQQLLKTSFYGLYHVANEGVCSRYDIALEIVKLLKSSVKVHPCSSDRFPLPALRSRSEALLCNKLGTVGLKPCRTWQKALEEYLYESHTLPPG